MLIEDHQTTEIQQILHQCSSTREVTSGGTLGLQPLHHIMLSVCSRLMKTATYTDPKSGTQESWLAQTVKLLLSISKVMSQTVILPLVRAPPWIQPSSFIPSLIWAPPWTQLSSRIPRTFPTRLYKSKPRPEWQQPTIPNNVIGTLDETEAITLMKLDLDQCSVTTHVWSDCQSSLLHTYHSHVVPSTAIKPLSLFRKPILWNHKSSPSGSNGWHSWSSSLQEAYSLTERLPAASLQCAIQKEVLEFHSPNSNFMSVRLALEALTLITTWSPFFLDHNVTQHPPDIPIKPPDIPVDLLPVTSLCLLSALISCAMPGIPRLNS